MIYFCPELNAGDNSKYAPKPDMPGVARLLHDRENQFKLSRWVCKHASEWADEADYRAETSHEQMLTHARKNMASSIEYL